MTMGQQEIIRFLGENPTKWFTSAEIQNALGIGKSTAVVNLKRLREKGEVEYRDPADMKKPFWYRYKE